MDTEKSAISNQPPAPVGFGEAFRYWLKLGFISFGGPTGQIAIIAPGSRRAETLDLEKRFSARSAQHTAIRSLRTNLEAQAARTYIGWMMHRNLV